MLVRCDLNVPLDGKTITDDTRIRASVPTVKYLQENGAKVLLASHLGRPKSGPEDKFSLGPVEMAKKSVRTSAQRNHLLWRECNCPAPGRCRALPLCRLTATPADAAGPLPTTAGWRPHQGRP